MKTSYESLKMSVVFQKIKIIRGVKVMLDSDLAELYAIKTKVLNQAVKRNVERFPADFMFQLTVEEAERSRSQFVTLKRGQNIKHNPYAFTEHGILMLSSVLNSSRAVQVNIEIMRAFLKMRQFLINNSDILLKLKDIESKLKTHDEEISVVFKLIEHFIQEDIKPIKKIGFV